MKKIREFFRNILKKINLRITANNKIRKYIGSVSREVNEKVLTSAILLCFAGALYATIQLFFLRKPVWANIFSIILLFILTVFLCFVIISEKKNNRINEEIESKDAKIRHQQMIDNLINNNKFIIELVDRSIKTVAGDLYFNKSYGVKIFGKPGWDYLIQFSAKLEDISNNKTEFEKPDSFIKASCLINAIINNPVMVVLNEYGEAADKATFDLNLDIALCAALDMISSPITHEINDDDEYVEKTHPKVDIKIPLGLDFSYSLNDRIKAAIYESYIEDADSSIPQMANFFELLYLYCQK